MSRKLIFAILMLAAIPALAAVTVTVNGSSHTIPQTNEKGWGTNVTAWIQAISQYTLQPSGGTFTLTADTDFGATYGLKSAYFKTRSSNPAGAGLFRLSNNESIGWRNAANSGNILLKVNSSDQLEYNGVVLAGSSGATFQDSTFSVFDNLDSTKKIAFQASGITTGNTRTITMADANVDLGDVATATNANTASKIVKRDGSGNFSAGTITASLSGNVTGNLTGAVTGNASTATALAANGANCSAGSFPLGVDASGAAESCTTTTTGNTQYTPNQYGVVISGSGNTMTVIAPDASTTKVLTSGGTGAAPTWQTPTSAPYHSYEISNCGLSVSVAANAMTVALKQADGSTDPGAGAASCKIGFRNSTATTGGYSQRSATAATSVVVSSGSTLGTANGVTHYVYVYAIDNAGTIELGVSLSEFDEGSVKSSTAEGGAGAADSNNVLYSTTARTAKAIRLIGRITISEATAGTWASAPTEVSLIPFKIPVVAAAFTCSGQSISNNTTTDITSWVLSYDSHNAMNTGTGVFTIPIAGKYRISAYGAYAPTGTPTAGSVWPMSAVKAGSASETKTLGGYSTQTSGSTSTVYISGSASFNFAAGDTVKIQVFQNSSAAQTFATSSHLEIERIGN